VAELAERLQRLEALIGRVQALDGEAREPAIDAIQALLHLHGDGLARILELAGEPLAGQLAGDELIGGLLLLHGLHPVPQEERVRQALDRVRPYLGSHGGGVELLAVEDGVVRLRLDGSCHGCPSSAETLKYAIEQSIIESAPDVAEIAVEGVSQAPPTGFVPLARIQPAPPRDWRPVAGLESLPAGTVRAQRVDGADVVFCRLDAGWYAYLDGCPGCGASLAAGGLEDGALACPACGHRYDVRAAGRCLGAADLHLRPLPLLVDAGQVRVAAG
jgi:Fe-S cluster biogenesis protein NfuA/nitrite reductase/ring-hydroxylating ferredoxin subunit